MSGHKLQCASARKSKLLVAVAAVALITAGPAIDGSLIDRAHAEQIDVSIKTEFHKALDPYGEWRHHPRWGEVWRPAHVDADWRPYQNGRWSYTNEWGWFWISDEDWGWVTDHYGRWVHDADFGWLWIPRSEWGPAWVSWRRGHGHIGWAPLPPDELVVAERDEPAVWIFVRDTDFLAPRIENVVMRERDTSVVFRETAVVNRTVTFEDRGFAVDPGIEPSYVAAAIGHAIRPVEVRPPVLAGTAQLPNAVEIRPSAGLTREATRPQLREAATEIRPATHVPPPQPLRAGEKGRLGEHPPAAARNETAGPQQAQPGKQGGPGTPPIGTARHEPDAAKQQGAVPERTPAGRQNAEQGSHARGEARAPGARGQVRGAREQQGAINRQEPQRAQPTTPEEKQAGQHGREQQRALGREETKQPSTAERKERQPERQGTVEKGREPRGAIRAQHAAGSGQARARAPGLNTQERERAPSATPEQNQAIRQGRGLQRHELKKPSTAQREERRPERPGAMSQQNRSAERAQSERPSPNRGVDRHAQEQSRVQHNAAGRGQLGEHRAISEQRGPEARAGHAQRARPEPAPRAQVGSERTSGRHGGAEARPHPESGGGRDLGAGGRGLPNR